MISVDSPYGPIRFPPCATQLYNAPDGDDKHLGRHVDLIAERYASMVEVIKTFGPKTILDIGSGLAVIDVFLARLGTIKTVHLMDGDDSRAEKLNGFHHVTPAWYPVATGVAVVKANVSEDVEVHGHVEDPDLDIKVDMIISTRAWGHHFPISAYLDLAVRALNPGGCIIVDIRRKTTGYDDMRREGFRVHKELPSFSSKCSRFVFVR